MFLTIMLLIMFSFIWKYLFGGNAATAENSNRSSEHEFSEGVLEETKNSAVPDQNKEDAGVIVDRVGVITSYNTEFGTYVIDRQFKADLNTFELGCMPQKEMNVAFCAYYCPEELDWIVTSVKRWVDNKERLIQDRRKFRAVNFLVQELRKAKGTAILTMGYKDDEGFPLPLSMLPKDYPVLTGDWMHVEMQLGEELAEEATILSVTWSDRTVITDRLEINDGIWSVKGSYVSRELRERYSVAQNDTVNAISVESDQFVKRNGRDQLLFRKRVLDLIVTKPPGAESRELEKELEDWTLGGGKVEDGMENRVEELFRDKCGVRVKPAVPIVKLDKVGRTTSISFEIENRSGRNVNLKEVRVEGIQDVCDVHVNHWNDTDVLSIVEVSCTSSDVGRTKELIILDFGSFCIGRMLIIVTAQNESDKISDKSRVAGAPRFSGCSRSNNAFRDGAELISVNPVRPSFFIPNKIPSYDIPSKIKEAYETGSDELLRNFYPSVDFTLLDPRNYVDRFSAALFFEELEQKKIRDRASLYNVEMMSLNQSNEYLLKIPGNYELGFQIQRADPILIEDVTDGSVNYKGYVERVNNTEAELEIQIKLSDRLNYSGGGVNVKFDLTLTPFRRQHFALRQAVKFLGPQWLFPNEVETKSPRIVIVEDRLERNHPTYSSPPFAKSGKKETKERPLGLRAPMGRVVESRVYPPNRDLMKHLKFRWFNSSLNAEQKEAVRRIVRGQARPLPYVIFGPPGTGKTVTVVEAILQIYNTEKISRILVTAPSNAAADIIAELLISTNRFKPGDLVRLNGFLRSEASVSDTIADFCTDGEYMDSVAKHRLIISTVTTAGRFFELNLYTGHFSHVFIDEAGYCTEPEAMIACVLAAIDKEGQVILAGDPKQLGPVLKCDKVNPILGKSFLERLMETPAYCRDEERYPATKYNPVVLTKLVKNYRSHEALLRVPSTLFYHDELQAKASRKESYKLCESLNFLPKIGMPLIFHGIQGRCAQDVDSPSCYNATEACKVAQYVQLLKNSGISDEDIGIITPYRKQVEKIRAALTYYLLEVSAIKVASVQEFQGGEKTVIIISTVRSDNSDGFNLKGQNLEFLYSEKLFNVAVTRAKALMIIVGNPHVLHPSQCWGKMLQYCVETGVYKGCDLPLPVNLKLINAVKAINNEVDQVEAREESEEEWW